MKGVRTGVKGVVARTARNASSIGSTAAVWKARSTPRRSWAMSRSARKAQRASMSATGPARTWDRFPLVTASSTPGQEAASSVASSRASITATMRPGLQWSRISRPRCVLSARPSSSESAPAAWSAAYSPTLCPVTADGWMPASCQSRTRAHWRA
ncbi:hypothetical protein SBADM41S_11324 [Streptomyces badius]